MNIVFRLGLISGLFVASSGGICAAPHVHDGECLAALIDVIAADQEAARKWRQYLSAVDQVRFAQENNFSAEVIAEAFQAQVAAFDEYERAQAAFRAALIRLLQICPIAMSDSRREHYYAGHSVRFGETANYDPASTRTDRLGAKQEAWRRMEGTMSISCLNIEESGIEQIVCRQYSEALFSLL